MVSTIDSVQIAYRYLVDKDLKWSLKFWNIIKNCSIEKYILINKIRW